MIDTSTYNLLVTLGFLILIYALADNRNHMYSNIVLTAVDGIFLGYLGQAVKLGAVAFTSESLADILFMFGWISFVYSMLMAYEAVDEVMQDKTNNENAALEEPQ